MVGVLPVFHVLRIKALRVFFPFRTGGQKIRLGVLPFLKADFQFPFKLQKPAVVFFIRAMDVAAAGLLRFRFKRVEEPFHRAPALDFDLGRQLVGYRQGGLAVARLFQRGMVVQKFVHQGVANFLLHKI